METLLAPDRGTKRNIAVVVALVIIYLVLTNIPNSGESLTPQGQKILALMVVAIISWVFEIVPIGIAAMIATVLQVPLGIMSLPAVMANFGQTILFFVIGCFCIAAAMRRCGIGHRLTLLITIMARGEPRRLLLLFMYLCGLVSMFISDLAITAMLFPIALLILQQNDMAPGKSAYGRSVMLGIPIAALIGGVGTPAGAPMNYLAISLLAQTVDFHITFMQWSCIGVPFVILLIPIAWWILVKMFPPEKKNLTGVETAREKYALLGPLTTPEWKFIVIFAATVFMWLTEWLPLPITSFLGGALLFFPGIGINDVSVMKNDVDWNVLMLNISAAGLGVGVMQTGAAAWMANTFLSDLAGFHPVAIMIAMSVFTVVIHLVIPVNSALVSIIVPSVALLSVSMGVNPAFMVLPVAFTTSCSMLLPLDTVPLLTYSAGYYKMLEMFKPGTLISAAWVVVQTVILLLLAGTLGFR